MRLLLQLLHLFAVLLSHGCESGGRILDIRLCHCELRPHILSFTAGLLLLLRCASISPKKSPWHLITNNLAIDRTRDIWNLKRSWSPMLMDLGALPMSMIESKLASLRHCLRGSTHSPGRRVRGKTVEPLVTVKLIGRMAWVPRSRSTKSM